MSRKWDAVRDLSRFYTSTDPYLQALDQQALHFLYHKEVNGRTLTDLFEEELAHTVQRNGYWDTRGGAQIYVKSFGAVPVLFCAPYATCLYRGEEEKVFADPLSMQFALSLSVSCGGTAVFPVCRINHPSFIDQNEYENPLVCALSRIMTQKRIALFIEVYAANWESTIGFFETPEYATLGWPDFEKEFSHFVQHIEKVPVSFPTTPRPAIIALLNELSKPLFCTWVRKQFAIPAVTLHLSKCFLNGIEHTDAQGNWERYDVSDRYEYFLKHAKECIPEIVAYCQFERQETGVVELDRLYRSQFADRDTQPLLPVGSIAAALPPGSENGVVDAASTLELLDGLYDRYGGVK